MPLTGLVQVSDYVLGDRTAPCRAVPGDGAIPLERILGDVLDAGYGGVFDLELVGPRIDAEGARDRDRTRRHDELSEILDQLGSLTMAYGDGPADEALRDAWNRLLRPAQGRRRQGVQGRQSRRPDHCGPTPFGS